MIWKNVYLHIPFCIKKCDYCSFFSVEFSRSKINEYFTYLRKEISLIERSSIINAKTIYFGGGTPSLMQLKKINNLIDRLNSDDDCEVTIEVNPNTISKKYAKQMFYSKVNRISIGAQSFIDEELKILGRIHESKQIVNAYNFFRNSGFKNISLDLIYALPNQTLENVIYSVEKLIELNPEHVSIYCLSLEKDVKLYNKINQLPDDELTAQMYATIVQMLTKNGYVQYEISNFAKPGFESKHNLNYWNFEPYLGLGAGATGFTGIGLYQNYCNIEKWQNSLNQGELVPDVMPLEEPDKEYIMMNLRKNTGINFQQFEQKFGFSFINEYDNQLKKLKQFLLIDDENVKIKPEHFFVSNAIIAEFLWKSF